MNISTHTFNWTIIFMPEYDGINYRRYRVIYLTIGEGMVR